MQEIFVYWHIYVFIFYAVGVGGAEFVVVECWAFAEKYTLNNMHLKGHIPKKKKQVLNI